MQIILFYSCFLFNLNLGVFRMNLKSKTALAALALIASTATLAQTAAPVAAAAAAPENTLAFNVGVVSQYRFRGIEQTSGKPAIQGGLDFTHTSGVYLGAWASNVNWVKDFNAATQGDYEVDLYGGYKGEIIPGLGYDLGVIAYMYPGNNSGAAGTPGFGGFSKADTTEFYVGLSYSVLSFKYSQSMGDFLGNLNSNGSRYMELAANFDLGNGYTLTPHLGRQTVPNQNFGGAVGVPAVTDGSAANYTDYALTLAKDFGNGWSATVAAVGTDAKDRGFYQTTPIANNSNLNRFLGSNAAVVGVKYSF
jgi:uncharacterized protein (TIGR02001 family)